MKNNSFLSACIILSILSILVCCGGGSDGSDPESALPNNEDADQDPNAPPGQSYAVPQREISTEDQNRLLGEGADAIASEIEDVAAAGESQSLRSQMSPVRDQGERYSASAFAAMALFEMSFPDGYDLSEQCLVYFSGSNDQAAVSEFVDYISSSGLFNESSCPYSDDPSEIPAGLSPEEIDLLSPSYRMINGDPSIASIRTVKGYLDRGRPMALMLWVSSDDWYTTAEVIRHPQSEADNLCGQSDTCGAHTVVFTGYDDIDRVLEFKNSWGTAWKDGGYGKITYEYFLKNYVSGSDNQLFTVEPD